MLLAALFATALAAPSSSAKAAPAAKPPAAARAEAADPWAAMVEAASPAIVSIDILSTRAFDTENAGHGYATGFVVDAERGIVLTNRHVVTPGPVKSEAITQENEVIPLRAIYRDPVHDFGFYQYDPATLRFGKLPALPLDPGAARVGMEIRVIGNNAGEKLSIHTGTIARLDRDAPRYNRAGFNDFNTFYLQAAAGTTGGSSGSPVLDIHGRVVALNAGARRDSAASYYLPLDRVARALSLLQAGKPVTRGSVHAVFAATAWDELSRLGLPTDLEAAARKRNPDAMGLLVVREVLPGGPAAGKLQVGDVVVKLEGAPIDGFVPLEAAFDDHVGGSVTLGVIRAGAAVDVVLSVADLHAATPSAYLELGGDVLHDLSFQQARNHNVPLRGVYVASTAYGMRHAGIPDGARLDNVAGVDVPDLATFERVVAGLPDQARVPVRYVELTEPNRPQVAAWRVERSLFPARHCTRDDSTGRWPCVDLPPAPAAAAPTAKAVTLPPPLAGPPGKVSHALVWVDTHLPFVLSGNEGDQYSGVGLIVDAARGLVVVDRDTVPQSLAEVSVIVGGAVRVPAKPVYFHPEHNLAVIQFDPALVTGVRLGEASFAKARAETGSAVWQVGLNGRQELTWSATHVQGYRPFTLFSPGVPQYRDYNLDLLTTTDAPLERGGVVVDKRGDVVAFLASFLTGSGQSQSAAFRGLPCDVLTDVADAFRRGASPPDRSLGLAWAPLPLSAAVDRGLDPTEAAALARSGATRILAVTHVAATSAAAGKVQPGDLLLAVGGKPTASWRTLEIAARQTHVELRIWRGDRVQDLFVPTTPVPKGDIDRAFVWAGALFQDASPVIGLQQGIVPDGAYVTWRWFGSPADRYDLDPTWRVVAVDGTPVHTLADFMGAVAGRPDRAAVRLEMRDLDDRPKVVTLRLDLDYWPAAELRRGPSGWTRVAVE